MKKLAERLQDASSADEWRELVLHDLKNPLAAIIADARFISRESRGDAKSAAENILGAAESLSGLLEELLDARRAGNRLENARPLDVAELAREVCARLARRAALRQQTLEVRAADVERCVAWGDLPMLRRVLENLIDNCFKFSPEGGEIRVEVARAAAGEVEVCVRDQGPGVPQGDRDRIFDRFVRLSRDAERARGHGLGLAYCRLAIEAHGGSISVEDNGARGACFRVRLPSERRS